MKKILRFLPLLLLFLACEQGVIFYDIAREIKLAEPSVIGNVNSIVELNGKLYTQNGNVYTKDIDVERGWVEMAKPGRVIALASDDTNLYALTAQQDDEDGYIHSYQVHVLNASNGWDPVSNASVTINSEEDTSSKVALFDNGVYDGTGRNAYFRKDDEVKMLTGTTMGSAITERGASALTVAAARSNSEDYFSDTRAFCSDGTDTLYTVIDGNVKTSSDNATWTGDLSISNATTMVYASDKLYVGTLLGLEQVTLDTVESVEGVPTASSNLDSNAEATTGEREIISIGYFGDTDAKGAIYAGAIEQYSTTYNALWGYYPSRGNWNYE